MTLPVPRRGVFIECCCSHDGVRQSPGAATSPPRGACEIIKRRQLARTIKPMPSPLRPLRPFAGDPPFTIDIWITDEDADIGKVSREGTKEAKAVLIHVHADAFEIIECPPNPSGIARGRARSAAKPRSPTRHLAGLFLQPGAGSETGAPDGMIRCLDSNPGLCMLSGSFAVNRRTREKS